MTDQPADMRIRIKIMGALIRDTRQVRQMEMEPFAQAAGIEPGLLEQYEYGEAAPSLPELESIAYLLAVPVERFLERQPIDPAENQNELYDVKRLIDLRHRMVGALLRKDRQKKGITVDELASQAGLEVSMLEEFELGLRPIPIPQLEVLSSLLDRSIGNYFDRQGPIGIWLTQQRAMQEFAALPLELQQFVSKPINRPYLELAQRLSEVSVDKLRAVAEGLLEITY